MKLFKNIFTKEQKSETKPMSVITTVPRPSQVVNRLSEEDKKKIVDDFVKRKKEYEKVSPYFIQEIFDRLYGPEAEDYLNALKELNSKYKPRHGRTGPEIYRDEI